MNLRSIRTVDTQPPPVIIEKLDNQEREAQSTSKEPKQTVKNQMPPAKQHQSEPPYPERLIMSKPSPQAEFDLL